MTDPNFVSRAGRRRTWLALVVIGGLIPAIPSAGSDRAAHLTGALEGLEIAMVHLEELGWEKAHGMIGRIADEVRQARRGMAEQREGGRREREVAERQLETLHLALGALREGERHDAAELVERAIRAREVALEGRRDDEAREIRRRGPNREQVIELLGLAEKLYHEFEMPDRARRIDRMTAELWSRGRERARERERGPEKSEREIIRHQIEIMRSGMPALLEAERRDTAELLEHAIHARELLLEGRGDHEAAEIRESAPTLGQTVEILNFAAHLWREFERPERAEPLADLAKHLWDEREGVRREREHREKTNVGGDGERMMHRLELLQEQIRELANELEELKRGMRRRTR